MNRYLVIILLIAILLSACAPAAMQSSPTVEIAVETLATEEANAVTPAPAGDEQLGGAVIIFHRTGGLAGVDEKWEIHPDGSVFSSKGEQYTIPAEQVTTLLDAIQALGFFEMKDSYGKPSQCKDCFTYELTVSSGGKVKSITTVENASDAPPELGQVLEKINTVLTGLK